MTIDKPTVRHAFGLVVSVANFSTDDIHTTNQGVSWLPSPQPSYAGQQKSHQLGRLQLPTEAI
jgi:hypothetical protein